MSRERFENQESAPYDHLSNICFIYLRSFIKYMFHIFTFMYDHSIRKCEEKRQMLAIKLILRVPTNEHK